MLIMNPKHDVDQNSPALQRWDSDSATRSSPVRDERPIRVSAVPDGTGLRLFLVPSTEVLGYFQ
jgi:hypothetical protein